jgi:hypothetical protein
MRGARLAASLDGAFFAATVPPAQSRPGSPNIAGGGAYLSSSANPAIPFGGIKGARAVGLDTVSGHVFMQDAAKAVVVTNFEGAKRFERMPVNAPGNQSWGVFVSPAGFEALFQSEGGVVHARLKK